MDTWKEMLCSKSCEICTQKLADETADETADLAKCLAKDTVTHIFTL